MTRDSETMLPLAVGDTEIEYSERGAGEPLVLVHAGVFGDWFEPLRMSPTLDGFRVIRVHRPGYGSATPSRHMSVADHAHAVGLLADRLGLAQIHWVGHSSSALMGLQLAVDRPELVHSLILLEPAPVGVFQVPASADLFLQFIGPAMGAFGAGEIGAAFDTFMRGEGYRQVIEERLGQAGYTRAVHDAAFFFRDEIPALNAWQFDATTARRLRQPVLVGEGGESARLGPMSRQITEFAMDLLPHAETTTIEGVNHMLPLQDPDAVGRVIADFARRYPISLGLKTTVIAAASAGKALVDDDCAKNAVAELTRD